VESDLRYAPLKPKHYSHFPAAVNRFPLQSANPPRAQQTFLAFKCIVNTGENGKIPS
jgi:hypothetical protein